MAVVEYLLNRDEGNYTSRALEISLIDSIVLVAVSHFAWAEVICQVLKGRFLFHGLPIQPIARAVRL